MKLPPRQRIGLGFDAHELKKGRRLLLGGVLVPHRLGLAGHSDADVLLHAVADALLGALALPDLGALFPDTGPDYKDADSRELLGLVYARVRQAGFTVSNLDCILVCDQPKLAPHAAAIRKSLARILKTRPDRVGLKAKTTEGTRLAVKNRSIACLATVLLTRSR